MKFIKQLGLALFLVAMASFIGILFLTKYEINDQNLNQLQSIFNDKHSETVIQELSKLKGETFGNKFTYLKKVNEVFEKANTAIEYQLVPDEETFQRAAARASQALGDKDIAQKLSKEAHEAAKGELPEDLHQTIDAYTSWLIDGEFKNLAELENAIKKNFANAAHGYATQFKVSDYEASEYRFSVAKYTAKGIFWDNKFIFFLIIIVLGSIGGLLYSYPKFFEGNPGIKHNGIFFNSSTNGGLIGILTGVFLIGFYLLLYFYHEYIAEWIVLVDPVAYTLRGEAASQWFMYGFLYTISILVMGVRMLAKYRHSNYHKIRTASVMFFQLAFAFLIPQILYQLNLPDDDLKNLWPLNYYFFFDWNITKHIEAGTIGTFMLWWGIVMVIIGIPLLTYFFGKRWYCSWVCGCGGLAETLGDPYRQLSDKSVEAWQIERVVIHGVLVFATVLTGIVLYVKFAQTSFNISMNRWVVIGVFAALSGGLFAYHRQKYPDVGRKRILAWIASFGLLIIGGTVWGYMNTGSSSLNISSFDLQSIYGFAIGSIFAGVVGTGFYPFMGNRMWCRFGCPLAAYLGLVQRFKSRFRITTNGGQCISCGNCSTYCEMGIDVRYYAQRGQNIVRSSCVGCGVCAAVCPRGVLALENGPNDGKSRMDEFSY